MDTQSGVPDDVPVPTSSKSILDPDTPIEDSEEMDATTAEDESMMAAMGLAGFGSTKVWAFLFTPSHLPIIAHTGQARRGKSRRYDQHQENANLASIHESVRLAFQRQLAVSLTFFMTDVVDSTGTYTCCHSIFCRLTPSVQAIGQD
jgi:xanthine/uracil/vitamin C permease (AzgA family)